MPSAAPRGYPDEWGGYRRDDDYDDDDDHRRPYPGRRRRGWLGEMFDFD